MQFSIRKAICLFFVCLALSVGAGIGCAAPVLLLLIGLSGICAHAPCAIAGIVRAESMGMIGALILLMVSTWALNFSDE